MTIKEGEALSDALDVVVEYRDTINSSWDYMSRANLNKYVTRIKRFFLLVFRLTIKYDVCPEDEPSLLDYAYDSKEKDFILIYGDLSTVRRYFMGRPAVSQLADIRRLHQDSLNLVAEDFRPKSPAPKKKAAKRKKKKGA